MTPKIPLSDLKQAVHGLSESERAELRGYVVAVFDVRGRDARVNVRPDERDRPRER
jgi:hypothetical protein